MCDLSSASDLDFSSSIVAVATGFSRRANTNRSRLLSPRWGGLFMNGRGLPLLPLSALAVLVILTFWLSRFVQPHNFRADGKSRHDPDLVVDKFVAQKLSPVGDVQYILRADSMMHYPDDDSSMLKTVLFTATEIGKPPLTANAPQGRLLGAEDEILLEGGVVIQTEASGKLPPIKLSTPKLTILTKKNIASSKDGVLMESPTTRINAASFELNSQTRVLVLNRVKGVLERIPQ
ncbi:MAG TPA: LPS export ABC transporter periplasmic protein LptC [Usitatibacteraceae bacterium]